MIFALIYLIYHSKTIFISPLDWGLGHATRCVPLIRQLMQDNVVILGVTASTRLIFDEEFPDLQKIDIEPYDISYSRIVPLALKLLFDSGRIFRVIQKEHRQLDSLIKIHGIDVVISDNRFGLYSRQAESVYITHQLRIRAGFFSFLANYIHHRFIKKFDQVWVPDNEAITDALAGSLSRHPSFSKSHYLGPLSRLDASVKQTEAMDVLILLSGVEPQRSMLEELLVNQLKISTKKIGLVRGSASAFGVQLPANITVIDLPDRKQLSQCIRDAKTVVCRSGYSTLMDLHLFHKKQIVLIPTPGQPEQLYLANYWQEKYGAACVMQRELNYRNVLDQFTTAL